MNLLACSGPTFLLPGQPDPTIADHSPVVARVNGLEYSLAELEREMAYERAVFKLTQGKELILQDKEGTLHGQISTLILDQLARQAEIGVTDAEVAAQLAIYAAGKEITVPALEAELLRQGVTLADFEETIARTVRIEKYLDTIFNPSSGQPPPDFRAWFELQQEQAIIEIIYEAVTETPITGNMAPDFALTNLQDQLVSLAQYRGQPVVINFWATWCVPCRREMVALQQAFEKHQNESLVILAVNFEEGPDLVVPFVEELGLTFEILYDSQTAVNRLYEVTGLPRTVFVDRRGLIRHVQIGELNEQMLADVLGNLIQ